MIYIQKNPFDFNYESTSFSDTNYTIVGKALTIATKFETEAKGIANILKLRDPHLITNKDRLSDFIVELEKFQHFHKTIKQIKINIEVKTLLERAIDSRNFIAHELTKGLDSIAESNTARVNIIEQLRIHVFNIAEAEKYLLTINCLINKEPMPNDKYYNSFSTDIVNWVIDTDI